MNIIRISQKFLFVSSFHNFIFQSSSIKLQGKVSETKTKNHFPRKRRLIIKHHKYFRFIENKCDTCIQCIYPSQYIIDEITITRNPNKNNYILALFIQTD